MQAEKIVVVSREILQRALPSMFDQADPAFYADQNTNSSGSHPLPFGGSEAAQKALYAASNAYRFADRSRVEDDPSLKQIIPYMIVRWNDRVFLMRRLRAQSEQRLWDKYSIGIGGHLNQEDAGSCFSDVLRAGMERELHEELAVSTEYETQLVGCINDDSNDVGRVHFGIVFQVSVPTNRVEVLEKSKMTGEFVSIADLPEARPMMESWSRVLLDYFLCRRP